ncbi:HEAT repeat domain-containing protein [Micromonospora echinofusca]|uniref:HEAT repeat domain-containing protein n=1 Tax=Micromonospora echinofusca TaxID=47858 RepID=UPI00332B15D1
MVTRMIDSAGGLEAVVRHATELEDDYDDIASLLTALTACGDITLVPRLHEALDRFLDEQNFYGRDLIAGILAGIQGVAALPALLRASARDLGDDQDSLTGEIIALLHTNKAAARRTMLDLATGGTPELRRAGLWALGFVVEAQDVGLLAAAAADVDPQVRTVAIGSIPDTAGDDRAFQVLVAALRDLDDQVRISAVSRLGYTGRADAVAPLAALAADPVPRVRSMVAYALGQLRKVEATPVLLRLRHDPDWHVRENALEALGSVGGAAAVDALLLIAGDEDPLLRAQAARALGRAVDSDPRIPQQLTALAQDDEPAVRAATISGLISTDSVRSRWASLVVGLANDPDPVVRQRVAVAARRLAPDAAPDILRQYVSDADPTVRRIADMELARLTDTAAR